MDTNIKLIVMCGLQGSGKSTKAMQIKDKLEKLEPNKKTVIISSDKIRFEYPELTDNTKVFNKVYADMNYWLRQGDNVILDATNITIKSRRQIFLNLKEPCERICHIMNTPYNICQQRLFDRNAEGYCDHQVPLNVLEKYLYSFEIPFYEEGWDKIELENIIDEQTSNINLDTLIKLSDGFNQRNKHHTQDLGKHMKTVGDLLKELCELKPFIKAGYFHDVGKLSTQTVGEDGNCHYYNHDSVGAYNLMCCAAYYDLFGQYKNRETLEWLFYINYHMKLHNAITEKSIRKWKNIFTEELYDNLKLFEKIDKLRP